MLAEVDALRTLAAGMNVGVEASVSLCVDAVLPVNALVDRCRGFEKEFPSVALRVDVQILSAVADRVLPVARVATPGVAAQPSRQSIPPARRHRAIVANH